MGGGKIALLQTNRGQKSGFYGAVLRANIIVPFASKGTPMFTIEYPSIDWWYWLVTVGFLTAGISGWQTGFVVAIGLW